MSDVAAEQKQRSGSGCGLVLKVGLGCLGIVVVLATAAVVLNWDRLTTFYRTAKSEASELGAVYAAVQSKYDTPIVMVRAKRLFVQTEGAEFPKYMLSIELVNAPFATELTDSELENKAREVAQTARRTLESPAKFDAFEINFASRTGGAISFGTTRRFIIPAEELALEPAEESK